MYITLESDYAVRIVSELCVDGGRLDAGTISQRCNVTLRFSLKILRKLVASGIVNSYKGSRGGYMIAMDPKDINLRMVVEAIEGTYFFSRCLSANHSCGRGMEKTCCFRKAFGEITEVIRGELERRDFEELTGCLREARRQNNNNEQGQLQA
ncbi:MAG: Rrf2 family transcriptional regulator [Ruminococcus sp.]|nr:Rrf2 family transcriptional regulator [Ruminococcus sp.]